MWNRTCYPSGIRLVQYLAYPICVFQRAVTFELKHCVLSLLVWFTFKTLCGSFMVKRIALPEDCRFCTGCLDVLCGGALAAACLQCIICLCFWKESLRWLGVRKHIWLLSFVAHDFCQGRKKDKKIKDKNSLYLQRFVVSLTSLTCLLKFLPRRICMMKCIIR